MFTSFKRIIHLGWLDFKRERGLSIATVFIFTLTISLFTSLFLLEKISLSLISTIQDRVDISVYFVPDLEEEEILKFKEEIEKIPEVKNVEYVSKEDALKKFTVRHRDDSLLLESLDEIGANPFFASLNVKAWQASQYAEISQFLNSSSFEKSIDKVDYFQKKSIIDKFSSFVSAAKKAGLVFGLILALLAVFISVSHVRLAIYGSKEEIETMKLVGASDWFIKGPFVIQAVISGIFAAAATFLIFSAAAFFLTPEIIKFAPELDLYEHFFGNLRILLAIQFAAGLGLGITASLIAVRKYLKRSYARKI